MNVRTYHNNDLPFLVELTNELGYSTTAEQMKNRLDTIQLEKNYWTYVVALDNVVIAYIGFTKNYHWEQDGSYIRIQALVVSNAQRRKGIGKMLIEQAEIIGKENGCKLLVLNCGNRSERASAHHFYPNLGFEPKSTGYIKQII